MTAFDAYVCGIQNSKYRRDFGKSTKIRAKLDKKETALNVLIRRSKHHVQNELEIRKTDQLVGDKKCEFSAEQKHMQNAVFKPRLSFFFPVFWCFILVQYTYTVHGTNLLSKMRPSVELHDRAPAWLLDV